MRSKDAFLNWLGEAVAQLSLDLGWETAWKMTPRQIYNLTRMNNVLLGRRNASSAVAQRAAQHAKADDFKKLIKSLANPEG